MQNRKKIIDIHECMYVLTMDTETGKVLKVSRPQYGIVTSYHELQSIAAAGYDVKVPELVINTQATASEGTRNTALLRLLNGEARDIEVDDVNFDKTFVSYSSNCKTPRAVRI